MYRIKFINNSIIILDKIVDFIQGYIFILCFKLFKLDNIDTILLSCFIMHTTILLLF